MEDMKLHPSSKMFVQLCEEMKQLHLKKAKDYGTDKDSLANIKSVSEIGIDPFIGCWMRAKDKVKRIDKYCVDKQLANESVEDSLIDLAAYSLIAIVLLRQQSGESKSISEFVREKTEQKQIERNTSHYKPLFIDKSINDSCSLFNWKHSRNYIVEYGKSPLSFIPDYLFGLLSGGYLYGVDARRDYETEQKAMEDLSRAIDALAKRVSKLPNGSIQYFRDCNCPSCSSKYTIPLDQKDSVYCSVCQAFFLPSNKSKSPANSIQRFSDCGCSICGHLNTISLDSKDNVYCHNCKALIAGNDRKQGIPGQNVTTNT